MDTTDTTDTMEKLLSLAADYLELKEVRDHYDSSMKEISHKVDDLMVLWDISSCKQGLVSISMANTSRTSVKGFKEALLMNSVDVELIASSELEAKPKPKYSPRISKLAKESKTIITKGIGG